MATTSANTYVRQAPFLEEQQRRLLGYAEGLSNRAQTLPRQQIAGLDPLTNDAFATGRGIGQYQPWINAAQGSVGSGLAALRGLSSGVGAQFAGGAGATNRAIQYQQGVGMTRPNQLFDQARQSLSGAGGQYRYIPGYEAQSFDPSSVSSYMNPYEDHAVQQALGDIRREGTIAGNQQKAGAVQAGAFGGSRQGLQSSELGRNVLEQQARSAVGMRQSGFQNAMQQAQNNFADQQRRAQGQAQFSASMGAQTYEQARQRQLAMGQYFGALGGQQAGAQNAYAQTLGGLGTNLAGIGAAQSQEAARLGMGLGSLGTMQANIASSGQNMLGQQAQLQSQLGALGQTQAQRGYDASYQNALRQQYEPYQRYNWMSDMLKPQIGSSSSTLAQTTSPNASAWSQLIGGGIGLLGLNKGITGNYGGLFGSGP
tara:strand:- start:174 stop:1451 length:1278 start_codon:yes stop_codon:yes gene_type:complete